MKNRDNLPREFRQYLIPMDAGFFGDFDNAFIFISGAVLQNERIAIESALPHGTASANPSKREAFELAMRFAEIAPFSKPPGEDDALPARLALLQPREIRVLRWRLHQVESAVWHALQYRGRDFESTEMFAVNPIWYRRWEELIGGQLLPAYIGNLSIDKYAQPLE